MERKEFIKKVIIRGSVATVLPALVLQSCEKDDNEDNNGNPMNGNDIIIDLDDSNYADLNNDGGSVALTSDKIIVINTGSSNFVALSTVCTHQGCTVGYSAALKELPCPCHGSVFSTDGSVLNGPASSPLTKYTITRNGNILTVKA